MCLVSYIPQASGYVLSSNRDESPTRSETQLTSELVNGTTLIYPKDHKGGSWIIASDRGVSLCVLNGAFENHKRRLPYRMSRGLMLKAFFNYQSTADFLRLFDFDGIEPFTLIIKDFIGLYEFRWDGLYKYIKQLDPEQTYVWSSSTLYSPEIRRKRSALFFELIKPNHSVEDIQNIHLTGKIGDPENDFRMNRSDRVATISHTNIVSRGERKIIFLNNLLTAQKSELSLL